MQPLKMGPATMKVLSRIATTTSIIIRQCGEDISSQFFPETNITKEISVGIFLVFLYDHNFSIMEGIAALEDQNCF